MQNMIERSIQSGDSGALSNESAEEQLYLCLCLCLFSFFNSLSLALTFINKHYRRIGGVSGSDCVYMQ